MCGDKSVLLAALLAHEGYAVCAAGLRPEKHMAVGVLGPGDTLQRLGLPVRGDHLAVLRDRRSRVEYAGGMRLKSGRASSRSGPARFSTPRQLRSSG